MKTLIVCLFFLPLLANAKYVPGDGGLDFKCHDTNTTAQPYQSFEFTALFDDATGKDGFDMISDQNLQSGNGDLVYQVQVSQYPDYQSQKFKNLQKINGCEFAPIKMDMNKTNGNFEIYFECDADGDAGFGTLILDVATDTVSGEINFPEGQNGLLYPIQEDTKIKLSCEF